MPRPAGAPAMQVGGNEAGGLGRAMNRGLASAGDAVSDSQLIAAVRRDSGIEASLQLAGKLGWNPVVATTPLNLIAAIILMFVMPPPDSAVTPTG